jgi:anthranilate synthase component 1
VSEREGQATPACQWREYPGFPDLAGLHALDSARYPYLLESVAHGTPQSRYDILFAFPGSSLRLNADGRLETDTASGSGDFLQTLDDDWHRERLAEDDAPFPFRGGWFLYLGYELAEFLEPSLRGMRRDPDWPIALAQRVPAAIIRDHDRGHTWLVSEAGRPELLDEMTRDLNGAGGQLLTRSLPAVVTIQEEDPRVHGFRIRRALEYIRAGDTFQANLSRAWQVTLAEPPAPVQLYVRLRDTNPAPFAGLAQLDARHAIVSSSPERLVRTRHGSIATRPIAGTRPRRLGIPGGDDDDRAALTAHPKERAEHIMLVDLERNDLGRICIPGSVRVDELLAAETYRHVHHLVSNVRGVLRPGITPGTIVRALFPGGTITGCPKVRTMQIISELEDEPRRAYTGSMGYLNRDGDLDLNILIRTLQVDGARVSLRAGGGIVADSDPVRELEETRAKARGLLAAFSHEVRPAC